MNASGIESNGCPTIPQSLDDETTYELIAKALISNLITSNSDDETLYENVTNVELSNSDIQRSNLYSRFLRFAILRQSANLEWAGGIMAGETLVQGGGLSRWGAALIVSGTVSLLEYQQSKWAIQRTQKSNYKSSSEVTNQNQFAKELIVSASALWQGGAATVEVNESLGLKSSVKRRTFQSGLYGTAVGAWITPIPPFRQLSSLAQSGLSTMLDHPIQSASGTLAVSAVIFSVLDTFKKRRQSKEQISRDSK